MTFVDLETTLRNHNIFEKFGLNQIGVFGSFARNEPYNDIDFLLNENLNFKIREKLKTELEQILKIKIDLVTEKFADPIILYRAKKDLRYAKK